MNTRFLQQARIWVLAAGLAVGVATAVLVSVEFGIGVFVTAVWMVASFWVLEKLLRAAVLPSGTSRNIAAVVFWGFSKAALYAFALFVLVKGLFPPVSHIVGLTLLLAVLVVLGVARGALMSPGQIQPQAQRGENE